MNSQEGSKYIAQHLPVFLNMVNRKILIVGGGELAFEQVLYILENAPDSEILVVAEQIDDKIEELREVCANLSIVPKSFEKSDLENQELVFITLKDALQTKQIVKEAKDRGILTNTPLYPEFNDFYIQADDVQSADIQNYTESHWKKIAFASIAAFFILILGNILNLFISYDEFSTGIKWLVGEIDELFYWMILIGFVAQLIDGLLGMGYGLTSTAALLSVGIPLPAISGSIHTAEMFSSGASGLSHYKFGNVNKKLLKFLIIPGVIGAVSGAVLLSMFHQTYTCDLYLFAGGKDFGKGFWKEKRNQKAEKCRFVGVFWWFFGLFRRWRLGAFGDDYTDFKRKNTEICDRNSQFIRVFHYIC